MQFDSLADFRFKVREALSVEKDLYRDDGFYFNRSLHGIRGLITNDALSKYAFPEFNQLVALPFRSVSEGNASFSYQFIKVYDLDSEGNLKEIAEIRYVGHESITRFLIRCIQALNRYFGVTFEGVFKDSGLYSFRACAEEDGYVDEVPTEDAQFWGLYAKDDRNLTMWIQDFETQGEVLHTWAKLTMLKSWDQDL